MQQTVTPPESLTPSLSQLTPVQFQAAHLLADGHSYSAVAQALNVGRATLYRWRATTPFSCYLNQLLKERADHATAASLHLVSKAQAKLQAILDDPSTPPQLLASICLRLLSIHSPQRLRAIQELPDDPETLTADRYRLYLQATGEGPDQQYDGGLGHMHRIETEEQMLAQAQELDRKYPDLDAQLKPVLAKMRQNETPTAKLTHAVQAVK